MSVPDAILVAVQCAEAFEKVQVGYFLGGSLASSLQGEPRATNDIDFVVDLALSQVEPLARTLGDDFDVDVVQLLRISGAYLEALYLEAWAPRLGVATLLARAWAEAG